MAVKRGLFKTKVEAEKKDSALDKYINKATSEYEEKALEEPYHSENHDNVSSHTDDVMPDSQKWSLCSRNEVSVAGITLNCWDKHKRNMTIWGIELTGKQPAAIELSRRVHSTDTRLHYHYIGISELW